MEKIIDIDWSMVGTILVAIGIWDLLSAIVNVILTALKG